MLVPLRLVHPPGARSCGGPYRELWPWQYAADRAGTRYAAVEMQQILDGCASADRAALLAELDSKLQKAQHGALMFVDTTPTGHRVGDVCLMEAAPTVLEIRLSTHPGEGDDRRKVRWYFSEPEAQPVLLALRTAMNYPDEAGLIEQTADARLAAVRGDEWNTNSGA